MSNTESKDQEVHRNPFQVLRIAPIDIVEQKIAAGKLFRAIEELRSQVATCLKASLLPLPKNLQSRILLHKENEEEELRIGSPKKRSHTKSKSSLAKKKKAKNQNTGTYTKMAAQHSWVAGLDQCDNESEARKNVLIEYIQQHLIELQERFGSLKIALPEQPPLCPTEHTKEISPEGMARWIQWVSISDVTEWLNELHAKAIQAFLMCRRAGNRKTELQQLVSLLDGHIRHFVTHNAEREKWENLKHLMHQLRNNIHQQLRYEARIKDKTHAISMCYHPDRLKGGATPTTQRRLQAALRARKKLMEMSPEEQARSAAELVFGKQVRRWSTYKVRAFSPLVNAFAPMFARQTEMDEECDVCETCNGEGTIDPIEEESFREDVSLRPIDVCADCKGAGEVFVDIQKFKRAVNALLTSPKDR
jgi:hypothetical protein